MKIFIQAIAIALVIGSASTASAHHVKSHRQVGASTYDALGPNTRTPEPATEYWGYSYDNGTDPHATTTGGPVGGLGS